MGVSVKAWLSCRRYNGDLCPVGHPGGPGVTLLVLISFQMFTVNLRIPNKNPSEVTCSYVATATSSERLSLFQTFTCSYNEVGNELVIAALPEDLWCLKGQKGIIVKILLNLGYVPGYGTSSPSHQCSHLQRREGPRIP